jgi:hypothetical protein
MTALPKIIARVEAAECERTYMIMSVKHTRKGDCWITFWRPGSAGYAYRMDWCGIYPESAILADPYYYDSRHGTYAVPAEYVKARAIEARDESGPALRVPHTPRMWRKLVRAACRARVLRDRLATQEQKL